MVAFVVLFLTFASIMHLASSFMKPRTGISVVHSFDAFSPYYASILIFCSAVYFSLLAITGPCLCRHQLYSIVVKEVVSCRLLLQEDGLYCQTETQSPKSINSKTSLKPFHL